MFLPLVQRTAEYLSQYEEPAAWLPVGRVFDLSAPLGAIVRAGVAGASESENPLGARGVVVSPSGAQTTLGQGGAESIELAEQGFYSARVSGTSERRPFVVAVDLDQAESDLTPLAPAQFLAGVTGRPVAATGQTLDRPEPTPVEIEKRQSIWWYLLVAGLVALVAETALSNRLSRRGKGVLTGTADLS